jgi:cation transport regulator ChaC
VDLWYFAYGSNLDPATFEGRRGIQPLARVRARLDGWRLVFDLPVGPGERGVANARPDPFARIHGIAYRIGERDGVHLDRTEGVHRGYYARVAVEVVTETGDPLEAFTYASRAGRPGRKPSARYLGILLRGARHHGLPAEWLAWLEGLELATDERESAGERRAG